MVGDLKPIQACNLMINASSRLIRGGCYIRSIRQPSKRTDIKNHACSLILHVIHTLRYCFYIGFCCSMFQLASAATLVISEGSDVVGEIEYATPQVGETLSDVGVRYGVGYYEMIDANPNIEKNEPLSSNTTLLIPAQFILPPGPHHGLLINLAEFRLYFFPEHENIVITYPIGIGRKGWSTPVGLTTIVSKKYNPIWHPTPSVLAHAEKNGIQLPDEIPAGPGNPLGKHALRLSWPTYLIHGASDFSRIGERVSAGCIRMLPDDIDYLYGLVSVGTPVRVINEPIKFGRLNNKLYMEVHPLLFEQRNMTLQSRFAHYLVKRGTKNVLNNSLIDRELNHPTGVPIKIVL